MQSKIVSELSLRKFILLRCTDSEFAVKCGGPQITSSNGIVYERENETLGPATYYVTGTSRWGVSNVGYFTGRNNPQYKIFSSSQFANTLDSELFQTARVSASSLRYYGMGLENGNYTVKLQFSETAIEDGNTWRSLGRRVFDVYVQVCLNMNCVRTVSFCPLNRVHYCQQSAFTWY